ncbi:MAG: hypothetical protein M3P08_14710 [Thermoproteota archaeon]|nr:hypothetical protein [Thermoproteota archaeon]
MIRLATVGWLRGSASYRINHKQQDDFSWKFSVSFSELDWFINTSLALPHTDYVF